jgi:serine/threonine protein kinase
LKGHEAIAGTPGYMAPEQFSGKEVTPRSDIYALGLVLYELFTGKRVFESNSILDLLKLHETSAPTNPSSHVKNIDPLVEESNSPMPGKGSRQTTGVAITSRRGAAGWRSAGGPRSLRARHLHQRWSPRLRLKKVYVLPSQSLWLLLRW